MYDEFQQSNLVPERTVFAVVRLTQKNLQFGKWHPTSEDAKREAERLAQVHNAAFGVIQLVGVMQPAERPVEWKPFENAK